MQHSKLLVRSLHSPPILPRSSPNSITHKLTISYSYFHSFAHPWTAERPHHFKFSTQNVTCSFPSSTNSYSSLGSLRFFHSSLPLWTKRKRNSSKKALRDQKLSPELKRSLKREEERAIEEIEVDDDELAFLIANPDIDPDKYDEEFYEEEEFVPKERKKKKVEEKISPFMIQSSKEDIPPGLYVIALPIGNLGDVTLRALNILNNVDLICAENPKTTLKFLKAFQINPVPLETFDEYVSIRNINTIVSKMKNDNAKVALVSDAGTPLISDPGAVLVEAMHRLDLPVHTIPGPSAVTALLSVSGFAASRFVFEGFLPKTSAKRKKKLTELKALERPIVFFESPYRIEESLEDCIEVFGESHEGVLGRELTKDHETLKRGTLKQLLHYVQNETRGEFTVILNTYPPPPPAIEIHA